MFHCELCNYYSIRSKLELHHIIPRSLGGSNKSNNLVYLCPTCHNLIYIDGMTHGKHSIKVDNSIIINSWKMSTSGKVLHFIKDGVEYFQESKNGKFFK